MEKIAKQLEQVDKKLKEKESQGKQELKVFDCDVCEDTGATFEEVDGYVIGKICKCQTFKRIKQSKDNSGLSDLLGVKTFDNYIAEKEFQKYAKKLAKEYVEEFKKGNKHSFAFIGQSGCVDKDTEYFNGTSWVKISEYKDDKVLQYHPEDGRATLTKPTNYIKAPTKTLYKIKTMRGSINQVLSSNHNFAYRTSKGNIRKKRFSEVMQTHKNSVQGFYGRVETAFKYEGCGIDLTESEIRLMVAVLADGHFREDLNLCIININKKRKIDRIKKLLKGKDYKVYKKNDGMTEFRFYAPRKEKNFKDYWYNCNNEQMKIIEDEIFRWDGTTDEKGREAYFSTIKSDADFVQFALASIGIRSTISIDDRPNKPKCYKVHKSQGKSTVSMVSTGGKTKQKITPYKPKDGMQYCFTVDTGYLVLRRKGRIFITGNSGKTHLTVAISEQLLEHGVNVKYYVADDIIQTLQACKYDEQNYNLEFSRIANCGLLVIDDLFKTSITNYYNRESIKQDDLREIFRIINYRCNQDLPILVNSEIHFERFIELDQATIGRINEMCGDKYLLSIRPDSSKNYRLKVKSF